MATFVEFLSTLNSCKQQSVFWHNQTTSYSEHKALNHFYDEITELLDALVEGVAGIYGRPVGYDVHDVEDYKDNAQLQAYFKSVYQYIETSKKDLYQESWIQNLIDPISELTATTLYFLTLTK